MNNINWTELKSMEWFGDWNAVDPKIEEDNPILLVKTDYTPY